jgi:hypothetical protein
MKVTSPVAAITNNALWWGRLDPGGYYTLDAEVIPSQEGPLTVDVTINYTDDFNQPREITQTLTLEVMPEPVFTPDPMMEGGMGLEPAPETFWSKVGRFLKGLLGLDSSPPKPEVAPGFEEMPFEEEMPVVVVQRDRTRFLACDSLILICLDLYNSPPHRPSYFVCCNSFVVMVSAAVVVAGFVVAVGLLRKPPSSVWGNSGTFQHPGETTSGRVSMDTLVYDWAAVA